MRFDTPIYFLRDGQAAYDPETGNYEEQLLSEDKKFANVTDSKEETMQLIYGSLKQGCLTIRLLRCYEKAFDRIRVGEKEYHVDWSRKFKTGKHVLVVSEVQ